MKQERNEKWKCLQKLCNEVVMRNVARLDMRPEKRTGLNNKKCYIGKKNYTVA